MLSHSLSNPCSSQNFNRLNSLFSPEINEIFFLSCLVFSLMQYYSTVFERKPENLTGLKGGDLWIIKIFSADIPVNTYFCMWKKKS